MIVRVVTERRIGVAACVVIAAIVATGFLLPHVPLPRLAIVAPIAYFVAVFSDAATALIVIATWRTSARPRASLVLALSFAVGAMLMAVDLLVLPLLPLEPPVFDSPPQAAIWLFTLWHIVVAAGALAYVAVRRNDSAAMPARRFIVTAVAIAIGVLVVTLVISFAFGPSLPVLAGKELVPGLVTTGAGPFATALLAIAAACTFRLRGPGPIDRALGFSLLALCTGFTIFFLGGQRYTPSFYLGRILLLAGVVSVLVSAVQTLIASRTRLRQVEGALTLVEDESKRRAGRIRAVWEISLTVAQPDADAIASMLLIATAALRPGRAMLGALTHLEDDMLVVDATASETGIAENGFSEARITLGARVPFERTMQRLLLDEGGARAWDDLAVFNAAGMLHQDIRLQSFIGTPVTIGRQNYFISFASPSTMMHEPFAEDDLAYVEVVASFFASRFAQQKQFERIQFQVEHDALTGLENRVQFRKAVRTEIATGEFTLALINLDGFRHVNEWEGYQIGDEVLVEVAASLAAVSADDLAARMSGDEFAMLIRGSSSLVAATAAVNAYTDLFLTPFPTGDRTGTQLLGVGASIGVARFPADGESVEELIRRAGVALDVAKARGGSTTLFFDAPMEAILAESHMRVVELGDAIARDHLALVYQPTFDLATREIVGAEALVRWDHPERGRLLPVEFIDFAERNGLIAPLTRWVLAEVVLDLTTAPALPPGARVYFNLAAQMLDDIPFISELNALLHQHPMLVQHLGIEVTESAAMQNVERSMNTIDLFRAWGLTVAIDDFGTGYSSLSYLKSLTVDMIKIDRSFVTGLPSDERDAAIVDMLLHMTERFGFTTLAEGVETEEQAVWLLEHGCRYGQGYLISKPHSFGLLLDRFGAMHATT